MEGTGGVGRQGCARQGENAQPLELGCILVNQGICRMHDHGVGLDEGLAGK